MEFVASDEVRRIKARLDHPVIDADGHAIEYLPLVRDILQEQAGDDAAAAVDRRPAARRRCGGCSRADAGAPACIRTRGGACPTRNTLDRATALLPACSRQRLDELGHRPRGRSTRPTGSGPPSRTTATSGAPSSRAFNTLLRGGVPRARRRCSRRWASSRCTRRTRRSPSSITRPAQLGLKAFMFGGPIGRAVPGADVPLRGGALARLARRRQRLRLRPRVGEVRGARRVTHVPHRGDGLADAQLAQQLRVQPHRDVRDRGRDVRAVAVPWRRAAAFPDAALRLPGGWRGVGRALYADLVGHWEKRNRDADRALRPSALDRRAPDESVRGVRRGDVSRSARRARRQPCDCSACPTRIRRPSTSSPRRESEVPRTSAIASPRRSTSVAKPTTP